MKLRTQFSILVVLFCVLLILIGVSVFYTSQQVGSITRQEQLANSVVTGAYELSYLSNDYLFHLGEERQNLQWESRFQSLSDDISRLEVNTPEEEVLVSQIKENLDRLNKVYTNSVTTINAARTVPGEPVDPELVQVVWSRVVVQNQGMIFDASRLSRLLHEDGNNWHMITDTIIFVLLVSFLVVFLITFIFIRRRLLGSISSLREGTRVIGSGNLDYIIEKKTEDEIGELTDNFNEMSSRLKQVTASKKELEDEIEHRKAVELAQRESEIRFTELFNAMSNGVAIYEVRGEGEEFIIKDINPAGETLSKVRREEIIGHNVCEIFPGVKDMGLFDVFVRVWKTGMMEHHPVSFYTDGRISEWAENYVYRLPGGEIVSIYNDVTEKKRSEDLIRETKEYLENLIRNASAPIITWDPDYKITEFNRAFELLTGLKREDVLEQPLHILFPEASCETSMNMIHWTSNGGQWDAVEIPIRGVSGGTRIVLWNSTSLKNKQGVIIATLAQGQDITERKAAKEALLKSEQTYRDLVENISDVLFSISPDYIITYISPVVKIFGLTNTLVEGRSFPDFIFPDDLPVVEEAVSDILSGRDVEVEFRIQNPSKDIFHVHVSARPEWKDGNITGIAGIMKDITSKNELERLKLGALQKIDENLIQMAAMNDQIRNPLAVIMAAADLAGGPTADSIILQVKAIDAMINELDRKWIESVKVREFLKKYYGVKG